MVGNWNAMGVVMVGKKNKMPCTQGTQKVKPGWYKAYTVKYNGNGNPKIMAGTRQNKVQHQWHVIQTVVWWQVGRIKGVIHKACPQNTHRHTRMWQVGQGNKRLLHGHTTHTRVCWAHRWGRRGRKAAVQAGQAGTGAGEGMVSQVRVAGTYTRAVKAGGWVVTQSSVAWGT